MHAHPSMRFVLLFERWQFFKGNTHNLSEKNNRWMESWINKNYTKMKRDARDGQKQGESEKKDEIEELEFK